VAGSSLYAEHRQFPRPTRPAGSLSAVEALICVTGLFHWLEEWVAPPLTFLLEEAKRFLPDNASVQPLSLPIVGLHETVSAVDTEIAEATRSFLSQCSQLLKSIDMLMGAASGNP
jgi:hypothetical protein